jgi:hypothetical protein
VIRWPVRFSRVVEPYWDEKPVAIVGGGPSLRGFDFERLRGRFHVLAVNASVFDIPFADAGFTIDQLAMRHWWTRYRTEVSCPLHFAIPVPWVKSVDAAPAKNMLFHQRVHTAKLQKFHSQIASGGTSGFGALNLAWLKRAKRIILFGFDYGSDGKTWHHNPDHYAFHYDQVDEKWRAWARNFDRAEKRLTAEGVQVVNASPRSRITAFPRATIEEALQWKWSEYSSAAPHPMRTPKVRQF